MVVDRASTLEAAARLDERRPPRENLEPALWRTRFRDMMALVCFPRGAKATKPTTREMKRRIALASAVPWSSCCGWCSAFSFAPCCDGLLLSFLDCAPPSLHWLSQFSFQSSGGTRLGCHAGHNRRVIVVRSSRQRRSKVYIHTSFDSTLDKKATSRIMSTTTLRQLKTARHEGYKGSAPRG